MGGKSDTTKYITEIPTLLALIAKGNNLPGNFNIPPFRNLIDITKLSNPDKVIKSLDKAMPIALETNDIEKFIANYKIAVKVCARIFKWLIDNNFPLPLLFDWQATEENKKDSLKPWDIIFTDHVIPGLSIKAGAPNLFNLGIGELEIGHERGDDPFKYWAPAEYDLLLNTIKKSFLENLDKVRYWTDPGRKGKDYGKYAASRVDDTFIQIRYKHIVITLTREELLDDKYKLKILVGGNYTSRGELREIPSGAYRVLGDYFQNHKHLFIEDRRNLGIPVRQKAIEVFNSNVISNPIKLNQLGGFVDHPYFYYDFRNKELFHVPSSKHLPNEKLIAEIINEESIFDSGIKLEINIRKSPDSKPASVVWYIRYHTGTFVGSPVNMIQNLTGKEHIWEKISY
jgi:hypothetical protein